MVCPITYNCAREFKRSVSARGYLYEDIIEHYDELIRLAQQDEPSEQTLRLRGFYAVETIYHDLPEVFYASDLLLSGRLKDANKLRFKQFPRSSDGLNNLIDDCNMYFVDFTVAQSENSLIGRTDERIVWRYSNDLLSKLKDLLQICIEAASALRPRLGGGVDGFGTIGTLLALAVETAHIRVHRQGIIYLETLLRTSIHNPASPFIRDAEFVAKNPRAV